MSSPVSGDTGGSNEIVSVMVAVKTGSPNLSPQPTGKLISVSHPQAAMPTDL